jgi:DNA-binding CsgD family transcriptional regulator
MNAVLQPRVERWGEAMVFDQRGTEEALENAQRLARQAGNALDAFGHACVTLRVRDGRLLWQTPLARDLLSTWFPEDVARRPLHAPQPVLDWLRRHLADAFRQVEPPRFSLSEGARRLTLRLHQQTGDEDDGGGEWLIVMREESDASVIAAICDAFRLTAREAEVLYWVVKGKINRDIADIVGASPATVKKHLEHVFAKLGVETRTAAAAMVLGRVRQLSPQGEG